METRREPSWAHGCSLWLLPASAERERLGRVIRDLATWLGTQPFEPHVTLVSGLDTDVDVLVRSLPAVSAELTPLDLRVTDTSDAVEFFRCVVLELAPEAELLASRGRALSRCDAHDPYPYRPHLSLVYGQLAEASRREVVASCRAEIGRRLRLDTLALVLTQGPAQEWRELAQSPLSGERRVT